MYDAIYRDGGEANPADCFLPDERLSFVDALKLYTTGAAYAAGPELHQGQIAKGKLTCQDSLAFTLAIH